MACGFQLRGSDAQQSYPNIEVQVDSKRASEIAHLLRANLSLRNDLADASASAARIEVSDYKTHRKVAAVNNIGEVSIYRITVEAMVTFYSAKGERLGQTSKISRAGNYNYDNRILNAMTQEENNLRASLNRELANAILRKASIILAEQGE